MLMRMPVNETAPTCIFVRFLAVERVAEEFAGLFCSVLLFLFCVTGASLALMVGLFLGSLAAAVLCSFFMAVLSLGFVGGDACAGVVSSLLVSAGFVAGLSLCVLGMAKVPVTLRILESLP